MLITILRRERIKCLQADIQQECLQNHDFILRLEELTVERRNILQELEGLFDDKNT